MLAPVSVCWHKISLTMLGRGSLDSYRPNSSIWLLKATKAGSLLYQIPVYLETKLKRTKIHFRSQS